MLESHDPGERETSTRGALDQAQMPQTESSGPDLDAEGDADYLNFFAQIEGILPTSFFSAEDGKPFDQSSIDIPGHLDGLKRLQERSRDLRLVAVEARLAVLNRDIAGFTAAVSTIAEWLENSWETVHPGAPDGRQSTVGTLDLPTVVFPLQYSPLFEARRIGAVTFRRWLIATGEVKPREGEAEQSASAITQAIAEADTAVLAAAQAQIVRLDDALNRIRNTFAAHGSSVDLPNLAALLGKMRAFIGCGAPTSDTSPAADGDASPDGMRETPVLADACPPPASLADAASALGVIADYYSRREPSSPILPLVRQARELVGKSFVEVMAVLMPSQVDKAAFRIGTDQVFELPVGRLSSFSAVAPDESSTVVSDAPIDAAPADEHPRPRYSVDSRAKAIALLDAVQRYFRIAEPSSPVPMLCERARGLAERDFMSVLRDVLPKAALRNVNADD